MRTIHVGLNKAASTWLQKRVFPNLTGLRPTGFRTGPEGDATDREIVRVTQALTVADDYRVGDLRRLVGEVEDRSAVPVLLSQEGLTSPLRARRREVRDRTLDRLAEELPDSRIVVVIRQQPALLLSNWRQYVKMGGVVSFGTFAAGGPWDPSLLDHRELVDGLSSRFGQVKVVAMEQLRDSPDEATADLLAWMGASIDPSISLDEAVHVSPGALSTHVHRWANVALRMSDDRLWWERPPRARWGTKVARRTGRLPTQVSSPIERRLSAAERRIARDATTRFADSNRALAGRLGIDLGQLGYPV